jgi:hypothetical protein
MMSFGMSYMYFMIPPQNLLKCFGRFRRGAEVPSTEVPQC